jgi:hypothetical protein
VEKYGRAGFGTGDNAICMPDDKRKNTDTRSLYLMRTALFPLQQWVTAKRSLNVTLYVHGLSCSFVSLAYAVD